MSPTQDDFRNLPIEEMEARVAHFSQRVQAAHAKTPPTKEWVRQAIHRNGPGRSPVRLKRCSLDIIIKYGDDLADLLCEYPDDVVPVNSYDWAIGYQKPGRPDPINTIEVMMREARWVDEWGTTWGHAFGGTGATPIAYPLTDLADMDDYIANRMPKAREPGRLDVGAKIIKAYEGKYTYGVEVVCLLERLRALRPMDDLLADFVLDKDPIYKFLDAMCEYLIELIRMWAEIGADGMFLADDWGMQTGLLVSPGMFREMFKPYYQRIFDEVHRLGMDVIFHSCGNVIDIVGDLIDAGVDCLDPIQPGAMDFDRLVREYGGKVAFSGAIDLQHLMCHGTPTEVKDSVNTLIDTFGKPFGGSFLIGPSNSMTPDIPLDNLRAMFEACHAQ